MAHTRTAFASFLAMCACLFSSACAHTESRIGSESTSCEKNAQIGRFTPATDLLIANFDSKPDVDDLQAVAGLGTVLADPEFTCVKFVATAGAYGTQGGKFIPAGHLFDLAFGKENWLDAHLQRDRTVGELARRARETIASGGLVWVTEAGQSDVTASMLEQIPDTMRFSVHVVQHSDWNETVTSADAFRFVREQTRYHRIPDGNFPDNGSPAFNTRESAYWVTLLNDPRIGPIWTEAKRLSDLHNPKADYVNPAVAAGGMDFSDTVEVSYVFGFDDMYGVADFVERFAK